MDGLSAATSVIAVIEVSAKVASLCFQYSIAVKDAKKDIERLQKKVVDINDLLGRVKLLLDGRDKTRLSATHDLADSLKHCFLRLAELEIQLDPQKTHNAMSRFGMRALKWPFTSKEVERIVVDLERYEQTFLLALQVDQTGLMLDFDQKMNLVDNKTDDLHLKIDLTKLPIAKGASFDSHLEEHNARCLTNTRVELRNHIAEWAKHINGKHVFWLNGMSGTGKSTIARTIARSFADNGQLGASFFFNRGGGDRGNAARFFTTIATDLMSRIPGLIPGIRKAIGADPAISEKALEHQFEKLILQPLSEIKQASPRMNSELIVVIDALDECDREEDIRAILQLLAQIKDIKPVSLRVFLTSRPEMSIRLGFEKMPYGTYQAMILHNVPYQTVERDIALFFEHELGEIREQRSLPPHWPAEHQIQSLVNMANPLFIAASTACLYIGDKRGNPKKRFDIVLQHQTGPKFSILDRMYLLILNQLFDDDDEDEDETDRAMRKSEFQEIVGSIVVLESPLSIGSLAHLLGTPREDISCNLDLLHSVLSIPADEDMPVRILHRSFCDFLLKRRKSPYWVDEREAHKRLTSRCLQLMSSPNGLRQNMCGLSRPGTQRFESNKQTKNRYLQPEFRYACRYWVHHLQKSKHFIRDGDPVHTFLQKYFFYWLEAMSLIGEASESIKLLGSPALATRVSKFLLATGELVQFSHLNEAASSDADDVDSNREATVEDD